MFRILLRIIDPVYTMNFSKGIVNFYLYPY